MFPVPVHIVVANAKPRVAFIENAYRLSRAAPHIWQDFLASFNAYVADQTEDAVQASPDTALIAHGRAQSLVTLRNDLKHIETLYRKINPA